MRKLASELPARLTTLTTAVVLGLLPVCVSAPLSTNEILAAYQEPGHYAALTILYPGNETVFPPEIVPCAFSWREGAEKMDTWLVLLEFPDDRGRLSFLSQRTEWTPTPAEWETIKQRSREQSAKVTVLGVRRGAPSRIVSRGQISISTSKDEVGAPLFYREVNLPFAEAVTDPSRIRWRFGAVSSTNPPSVVLEHLPVCGNCHSFSQDGKVLVGQPLSIW